MVMTNWAKIQSASVGELLAWAESQSWARAMAACQQDSQWHAEGDVWTHTKMVCAEVERLSEWPKLDRDQQLKVLLGALFHDSGKPDATTLDPESGRLRSPKHSLVGAGLARQVLRQLGCDLRTREEIVALARFHGRPPHVLGSQHPEHDVIALSWQLSNRLLYLLALADTRGRSTAENLLPIESLEIWKMLAEEHDCFHRPYPFGSEQARFLFFRNQLSNLHYVARDDFRSKVTLMSGLPGSGKDMWLASQRPDLPVVSLDEIRGELDIDATENQGEVVQMAREQCREHLRAGREFAFNATNTTRELRSRWISLFAEYGARIEIIYVEPPLETVLANNKRRPNPVPERIIRRLLDKLDPPSITECHSLTLSE